MECARTCVDGLRTSRRDRRAKPGEEHGKELWGREKERRTERKEEGTCDHREVSNGS